MKKLHCLDLEQKRLRKYPTSNEFKIRSAFFVEYFPKYQKEFMLTHKNGAIKSKLKGAKIIESFRTSFKNRSDWRVLLATK